MKAPGSVSNLEFGLFFSVILFASSWFFVEDRILFSWLNVWSCILLFISTYIPVVLQPFNNMWGYLGKILSLIFPPVILSIYYIFIFIPIAVFIRFIVGRDELKIKLLRDQPSAWISTEQMIDKSWFENQF